MKLRAAFGVVALLLAPVLTSARLDLAR